MSSDAQELDRIAAEASADVAASVAAQAPAGGIAPQADPAQSLAGEIAGLIGAMVATLSPALPSLKPIYTPETVQAAAEAVARVCVKHGWLAGGVMGAYAEEMVAVMVVGPLAVATWQGVRADLVKLKAKKPEGEGAPPPASVDSPSHEPMVLQRG